MQKLSTYNYLMERKIVKVVIMSACGMKTVPMFYFGSRRVWLKGCRKLSV